MLKQDIKSTLMAPERRKLYKDIHSICWKLAVAVGKLKIWESCA